MRHAAERPSWLAAASGDRPLSRAGLRVQAALALTEHDLDVRRADRSSSARA
jgi:hypothetical protein